MTRRLEPLDVTDAPEVRALAEEVARTGVPRVLTREGADLAVISPVSRGRGRLARSPQSTSPNDWLDDLIGIGRSSEPSAVSSHIHAHVAKALNDEIEQTTD
jgi:hypothetical protein